MRSNPQVPPKFSSMKSHIPRRRAPYAYATLGVLALLALRLASAWSLRVDSDEPQHLHVVWAWTQGLLPYRDVFDNHTPLFQMLMAPLLALLGPRADIIPWMRSATIPFWLMGLAATWWLGRRLWNPRVAWMAVAVTALFPLTYLSSVQFRTDDLWWPLWVAAVAVSSVGAPRRGRLALGGLLAGLTFAVSMKTSPLLAAQLIALAMLALFWRLQGREIAWRRWLAASPGLLFGLAAPLGVLALFFASRHALKQAWYFTMTYNVVSGLGDWSGNHARWLLFPAVFAVVALVSWRHLRSSADPALSLRRLAMFDGAALYVGALFSYWPLITLQDLLPAMPLLVLGICGTRMGDSRRPAWGWAALVALELLLILAVRPPWRDGLLKRQESDLGLVLKLTRPDNYVLDAKGESIFRMRPIFWVFEDIARYRIAHGLLDPHVRSALVSTGTPVVMFYRMPDGDRRFILSNYLPVQNEVLVLGQRFSVTSPASVRLHIAIPQQYALTSSAGRVNGVMLDGKPWHGIEHLAPGDYVLRLPKAGHYAVVWAPALERGLTPLDLFTH